MIVDVRMAPHELHQSIRKKLKHYLRHLLFLRDNDRGCLDIVCEAPDGSGQMYTSKPSHRSKMHRTGDRSA